MPAVRVPRDHEMLVRGVGVHARRRMHARAVERGQQFTDPVPHLADLVFADRAVDRLRGARHALAKECDLDPAARPVDGREPVDLHSGGVLVDEDRVVGERGRAADGIQPVQHLALDADRDAELSEQLRRPGPGTDHHLPGGEGAGRGPHRDPVGGLRPVQHLFTESQCGSGFLGQIEVGLYGQLRAGESGLRLEQRDVAGVRREVRVARPDLGGVEQFVRQVPFPGRTQTARDGQAVRGADEQAAGHPVHVAPAVGGEFLPQLVGAQQQRHVGRVLEIGLPDDPGSAMAGALVVGRGELLQAEDPLSACGQVVGGRAAHPTEPDDDDVVAHRLPLDP